MIGAVRKENDCKNDAEEKLGSSSCDCDGETIEKITCICANGKDAIKLNPSKSRGSTMNFNSAFVKKMLIW